MLHLGEEDGVALTQVVARPRVGDEVDGFGHVLGEDQLAVGGGADEAGELAAGAFVGGRRLLGDGVDAAVGVRVMRLVDVVHRIEHGARLLRRRSRVEVDEPAPVHLTVEEREVLLDAGHVERHDSNPSFSRRWASSGPPLSTTRPSTSTCTASGSR